MTLRELNKIEQVLRENADTLHKARIDYANDARKKYDDGSDWYRDKMEPQEQEYLEEIENKDREAAAIYESFMNHNWQ